jgi:hypothetical protein
MLDADASFLGTSVNPCRFSWLLLATSIDPLASLASPSENSKLSLFCKASKDADNSVHKLVPSCPFMITVSYFLYISTKTFALLLCTFEFGTNIKQNRILKLILSYNRFKQTLPVSWLHIWDPFDPSEPTVLEAHSPTYKTGTANLLNSPVSSNSGSIGIFISRYSRPIRAIAKHMRGRNPSTSLTSLTRRGCSILNLAADLTTLCQVVHSA